MISSRELAQAFIRLAEEHSASAEVVAVCLAFLKDNHREYLLPHIVRHMETLTATDENWNTLQVITAFSEHAKDISLDVAKKLKVDEENIATSHDSKLIGGFIAEYQGVRYDASIRNHLEQLHANLVRG